MLPAALLVLATLAALRGASIEASLPLVLCNTADPRRSGGRAETLRSEPLAQNPRQRMTTQLVRFAPGAASPRHVHGGDLTVYVLKGTVRSEHAGLPLATYQAGEVFHEPQGTVHVYIDNPSATEEAELLAVMVHDEGAALTTFLD